MLFVIEKLSDKMVYSLLIKTRLPASRSSSIGPKGCFSFLHPKVKGGGVSVDKSENHGLKIHFKSFQAILDNVVFYAYTSPPNLPEGGGGLTINKN